VVGNGRPTIRKSVPIGPPYYRDAGDPPTLQTVERTDRPTTRNRKTVLCTIVPTSRGKTKTKYWYRRYYIGIADIVLPVLSILSIDPALHGNAHTTWKTTLNFFPKRT